MFQARWTRVAGLSLAASVAATTLAYGAVRQDPIPARRLVPAQRAKPADALPQAARPRVRAPETLDSTLDAEGRFANVWEYLRFKYDKDSDGRVSKDEYARKGENFARLDRDRDGHLTLADFQAATGPGRARGMTARMAVACYFQADESPNTLAVAELEGAIGAYDTNTDGRVDAAEFDALAKERAKLGREPGVAAAMPAKDAFQVLVAGLDLNSDGVLGGDEIVHFFREHDEDGDLVWDLERAQPAEGEAEPPPSGPAVGTPAPDFELEPYQTADAMADVQPVQLSSFRGKRPVALIFGSYT